MTVVAGLYIFGFGGHARSVADVAVSSGIPRLLFVDANARPDERFAGFEVTQALIEPVDASWLAFVAVGDNDRRRALSGEITIPLATIIAPTATVGPEAILEGGVVVGQHAHIGPAARVGRGTIVNTGAIVDHETIVGSFSHISVGVTISGRCLIGSNTMIGAGSTVIDGITIGDNVIIGAGATVVHDITQPGIYVGTPARPIGTR